MTRISAIEEPNLICLPADARSFDDSHDTANRNIILTETTLEIVLAFAPLHPIYLSIKFEMSRVDRGT